MLGRDNSPVFYGRILELRGFRKARQFPMAVATLLCPCLLATLPKDLQFISICLTSLINFRNLFLFAFGRIKKLVNASIYKC